MITNDQILRIKNASTRIRKNIIEMTYGTGDLGAHLGGSLSIVELLAGLYLGNLRFHSDDSEWCERDRVILSKGHAAMALYPTLAEAGIIDFSELKTFKMNGSRLGGHPSLNGLPGIEFASGSLGQGLSLGVGTAIALKRKGLPDSRVFVFMGDGECDEGSVWEAAASASHYKLNNLVAVVDINKLQYDGSTSEVLDMSPLENKWLSFGWDTSSIDGHNIQNILSAYNFCSEKPYVILANTIKGKGISFMENNPAFHNSILSSDQYMQALKELESAL